MIIYNVTTQVADAIQEEWKDWMFNTHLPEMMSTKLFSHYQVVRVLELDDEYGPTYAVQYYFKDDCTIGHYREKHLEIIDGKEKEKWRNEVYSFSSLMEVIN